MKKRIITFVFMAMIFVALAVLSSAKTAIFVDEGSNELFRYTTSGTNAYPIQTYSGEGFLEYDANGDALTWYVASTTTLDSGETQYTVKSEKTKNILKDNGDGVLLASEISNYSKLVSIVFDEDCGITRFGDPNGRGLFHKGDGETIYFLFISIPDCVTALSNDCFRNDTCLLEVEISENSKLTDLGSASFYGCASMREIYIPKGVTVLKTNYIGDKYWEEGLFRNCQKLADINFAEDSQLEVIEKGAFNYCNSLKTITLPNSVKTIHPRVFAHCPALTYVNFGAGLIEIVRDADKKDEYVSLFQYTTKLKTVVLPVTFKAENLADDLNTTFAISDITVYYAGTEEEFKKLQDKFALATYGSGNPGITNATYNYINTCEAFYGNNHQTADEVNDHNCTTDDVCRCGNVLASKAADAHTEFFEIVYTSYTANGTKAIGCSNDGCTAIDATETLKPLFITKGYSIKEDGYGVTAGYDINIDALCEYEKYVNANGKTFKLGIIMANATTFGDDFMVDGALSNANGMQLELTSRDYVRVTAAIADFTMAEKDLKLVMSLYVIDDGKVSYIQHKGQGEYAGTVLNEAKTTALDIVTIQNIANLTGIDLKLPEPTVAIPAENKEDQ